MNAQKVLIQRRLEGVRQGKRFSEGTSSESSLLGADAESEAKDSRFGLTDTIVATSTSDYHSVSDETGNRSGKARNNKLLDRRE